MLRNLGAVVWIPTGFGSMNSKFARARSHGFIARTLLFGSGGKAHRFLRFSTTMAIIGIAIGVMTLILALGIVRGFDEEIQRRVAAYGAQIHIEHLDKDALQLSADMRLRVEQDPDVTGITEVIEGFALAQTRSGSVEGVLLRGEYPSRSGGSWLDKDLARTLGTTEGDTLTLVVLSDPAALMRGRSLPRLERIRVDAVSGQSVGPVSGLYLYAPFETVRALNAYEPGTVSRLEVALASGVSADLVAKRLTETLGYPYLVRSIQQIYRGLFAWVDLQQQVIPLVLAIILVVAALNAATVLLIFVIAKRPQFALLQALGQPPADLVTTVRLMALYIAGIGVGLGCALGMVLGWVQYSFGLIRIPAESYMLDVLPMALYASDGLLVVTGALGLVLLVTQMPIRVLQKQRVVDALQWR